jgi:hypothetical protein
MTQQFRVDSEAIRDKLNTLLPSQSRGSIGVDLSGSTTIIPIVDLTEIAEGSSLRQDLQTSFSHTTSTPYAVSNTTSTIISTTGYFRIFGQLCIESTAINDADISITDGTTPKKLLNFQVSNSQENIHFYDFLVKLGAGDSITATTTASSYILTGVTRQIADLSGNLVNP